MAGGEGATAEGDDPEHANTSDDSTNERRFTVRRSPEVRTGSYDTQLRQFLARRWNQSIRRPLTYGRGRTKIPRYQRGALGDAPELLGWEGLRGNVGCVKRFGVAHALILHQLGNFRHAGNLP